ncbi:MAG: hypothetical protein OEZ68_01360 [Gammaproteobacteria bacterium]|nr:hypothetical protein [Gammaproteobacteria bacterium]MDH5799427.1 hypothetical protein [Gammaproteobacteria bacterium]
MKKTILCTAICAAFSSGMVFAAGGHDHGGHGSGGMAKNPSISVELEGRYASQEDAHFHLDGFQDAGGEGTFANGFSTGHSAINFVGKMSPNLSGMLHMGISGGGHEGGGVHVEEAYVDSKALGNGINVRMGQFYSGIGILNSMHGHMQDFATAPLVYLGLFGGHLEDTGVQATWSQNVGVNVKLGVEATTGTGFPGGTNADETNTEGLAVFAKVGGKVGANGSWSAGVSMYSSAFDERHGDGHSDDGSSLHIENGETDVTGFDLAYTMAPNGMGKTGEISLRFEYFIRDENGGLHYDADGGGVNMVMADYDGEQTGYYLDAIYSFMPSWRVGLRWESLEADNTLSNVVEMGTAVEDDTGMHAHEPSERMTLMVDVDSSPSSKVRLQYMSDESGHMGEDRIYMQYLVSLSGS